MIKNNLKELLRIRNMSQKEFAEKLGTTEASISRYVNGERIPKIHIAIKMADILGVNERLLFPLDDNPECRLSVLVFIPETKTISSFNECPVTLQDATKSLDWYINSYEVIGASISDLKGNILWIKVFGNDDYDYERIEIL